LHVTDPDPFELHNILVAMRVYLDEASP